MLQALSKYLEEHYKSKPLDQIYTMVTKTVAEKCHTIEDNDYKHTPQTMSTLRAPLFLTGEPEVRVGTIEGIRPGQSTAMLCTIDLRCAPWCTRGT